MSKVTLSDLKLSVEWAKEQLKIAESHVVNFVAFGDIDEAIKEKDNLLDVVEKRYNVLQKVKKVYAEAANKLLTELTNEEELPTEENK